MCLLVGIRYARMATGLGACLQCTGHTVAKAVGVNARQEQRALRVGAGAYDRIARQDGGTEVGVRTVRKALVPLQQTQRAKAGVGRTNACRFQRLRYVGYGVFNWRIVG